MYMVLPPLRPQNTSCVAHYTRLKCLESILRDTGVALWATRYGCFDDQQEYIGPFKVIAPFLKGIAEDNDCNYDEEHEAFPYILSFSNGIDSKYMWEHYGDNGSGVMLIFDRVKLYQYCNDFIEQTGQTRYCEDVVYESGDMFEAVSDAFKRLQSSFPQTNIIDVFYDLPVFIKNKQSYAQEMEFRLTHCCYDGFTMSSDDPEPRNIEETPDGLKFRKGNDGRDIPYIEIELPKETLVAVCFGCQVSERERESVYRLLTERKYTAGIFQSKRKH